MTGTLEIRYRRPTPLHTDLRFEGRLAEVSGRKIAVVGGCYAGEVLTAEAKGLFIAMPSKMMGRLLTERDRHPADGRWLAPARRRPTAGKLRRQSAGTG